MKKLVIVLMSVLLASFAFAQFDLGIKLGANYSYIESEELDPQVYLDQFSNLESITGVVGGAFAIIGFGNFGIQLEGLFSVEGFDPAALVADETDPFDGVTVTTNYLNAVAMARYNIDLAIIKPFIGAGINLGIPLGTEVEGDAPNIDLENFDFTNIGLAFAAGVNILDMVDVELRYVKGMTDISTQETTDGTSTFSNLVRLSLGLYIF